jgi:malate synthase
VRDDKLREVRAGHDGTWVAHPGLVPVARAVFDKYMPAKNQITMPANSRSEITEANLLEVPRGRITQAGLRRNVDVALRYLESWLRGNGCVPIYNLMEDAATAEICRAQLWQWIRYGAKLDDGRTVTADLHDEVLANIMEELCSSMGAEVYSSSRFERAGEHLRELSTREFHEFLTTTAYADLA